MYGYTCSVPHMWVFAPQTELPGKAYLRIMSTHSSFTARELQEERTKTHQAALLPSILASVGSCAALPHTDSHGSRMKPHEAGQRHCQSPGSLFPFRGAAIVLLFG